MDRLKYFLQKSLLLQFGFFSDRCLFHLSISAIKSGFASQMWMELFRLYGLRDLTLSNCSTQCLWNLLKPSTSSSALTFFDSLFDCRAIICCLASLGTSVPDFDLPEMEKKVYRWMKSSKCAIFSQPVCQSVSQLVDRSILFSQSVSNLVSQWNSELVRQWESKWVSQSVSRSVVIQLFYQSVSQLLGRSICQSVSKLVSRWVSEWVSKSVCQWVSQWVSESVSKLVSHSVSRLVNLSVSQ